MRENPPWPSPDFFLHNLFYLRPKSWTGQPSLLTESRWCKFSQEGTDKEAGECLMRGHLKIIIRPRKSEKIAAIPPTVNSCPLIVPLIISGSNQRENHPIQLIYVRFNLVWSAQICRRVCRPIQISHLPQLSPFVKRSMETFPSWTDVQVSDCNNFKSFLNKPWKGFFVQELC